MVSFNLLLAVSFAYVSALFLVAFWAERRARDGRQGWLRSPIIYTLSLSVYCTAWTFYGAVGNAARSGLEFLTIYLGPTLVFVGWWWLLRKLVRVGRSQRVTSIADLISARFGKSNLLAVIVTLLAVLGTTPYIALQLQSVTLSLAVFANPMGGPGAGGAGGAGGLGPATTAGLVAAVLAVFTILFGTRNLDVNERHHGVVMAIAVEAVVKLVALLAVGIFVVWGIAGGPAAMITRIEEAPIAQWQFDPGRWVGLTFLAATAVVCLPRMFQVMVVENSDERHLATAAWAFPLYLFAMSLFVVPIAVVGLAMLPEGSNPDLFVLSLPLSQDQGGLATLAFLGGFSSATSMVIVASIALSTMVSNHVVVPLWLALRRPTATMSGDLRRVVLTARRVSIGAVLALGYGYFRLSGGGEALAAIGLISFAGVAQVLPALVGGLFWRGATRLGAAAGLLAGFAIWAYALFLPSFGAGGLMSAQMMVEGPWGLGLLRPHALFGVSGMDPLLHALTWSMGVNTALFVLVSLLTFPAPLERLQGALVVNAFAQNTAPRGWAGARAETEDLLVMAQRILGPAEAQGVFRRAARAQGKPGHLPDPTPGFVETLERELAGSVGAATAHAMVAQIAEGAAVSVEELLAVADETAQMKEYSTRLEVKSQELSQALWQLGQVNAQLTAISVQKDAFLSQISHELRTPMTSILSFAEILRDGTGVSDADARRFSAIIHEESTRLTRLLDDLLDLSVLENGRVALKPQRVDLCDLLDRARITAANGGERIARLKVGFTSETGAIALRTDADRLSQVFINLISNAGKYCDAPAPRLNILARRQGGRVEVDFIDNGSGIPESSQAIIFEKFARLSDDNAAGSTGLGLSICREIMTRLGGELNYLPGQGGAAFRVSLPDMTDMTDMPGSEIENPPPSARGG